MDDLSYVLFCVFSIGILVVFAGMFYLPEYKKKKSLKAAMKTPVQCSNAVVVSKTTQLVRKIGAVSPNVYYVSFELENGERKSCEVNVVDHNILKEGDEGLLSYHEYNGICVFVDFKLCRK